MGDPALWRHRPATGETDRLPLDETPGFVVLTPDPATVVAGLRSGLARLHRSTGARTPLAPGPDEPGNRLNGGRVGPDGALYFGTMNEAEAAPTGTFYRWDGSSLEQFGGRMPVANGPVWSPDGRVLYTVDTGAGVIRRHAGWTAPPEDLIRFEPGWGKPDGLAVDAQGYLWACHYGGSRITRCAPDGTLDRIVPMPTALVTHCTFGGPDLTTLYVTTGLRDRDPTIDPMAGHLFTLETGIRGVPARIFTL
ncbi:SMP-30/gluconolactonase/LRE family protein [Methylobacterium variabile]|uniref:SMP-30/gluconolactonase/LRE family protein n=1 Tax=Methylobacterium variabile TaxID=298794 RepID=UPI003158B91C